MSAIRESASNAVERALAILEAVSQRSDGMTNSEINRKLGIPKSTASYILRALEQRGYLRREPGTRRYRLGLKVLNLGRGVTIGLDLREVALPLLRQLVERCQLTAHLAILDQSEAVYIEKVEAPGFIKMNTWVGRRLDVHSTAVGKALVAYLPQDEAEEIVRERGLRRLTPRTITARSELMRELERVREKGYAVDDEENSLGVRCVAAPVFDRRGKVIAAVGVSGTVSQIERASLPRIADLVKEAARKISQRLGGPLRVGSERRQPHR